MPDTPVTWLDEFNVTATSGPNDPDIIQLANGNILVSWTSSDPARPNASGGSDTIGQIFDPMGVAVGGPFRINQGFFADDEIDADLHAVPGSGGGFVAVYEDVETGGTPLRVNVYDAAGAILFTNTIESDGNAATQPNFRDPHVAISSSTSALVVYQFQDAGGTRIAGRIYDPTNNTVGSQISLIGFSLNESQPDVAVLSNGNYVITCTDFTGGDNRIAIRIVNSAGGNVLAASFIASTNADGFSDSEPSVTALTGGGFVISYTDTDINDTDVSYRVFNAAGTEIGSGTAGTNPGSTTNLNNESVVAGLADGSFVVIVDNDEAGFDRMEATHVSAAGTVLGTFVFSGAGTDPAVIDLGDGRFAVTWQSLDATGGVRMEILDTRDFVNPEAVYDPEPNWQVGTIFDDVIVTDSDSDITHGHLGNDDITDSTSSGGNQYFGDQGNDILRVGNSIDSDTWDGGADIDTLDLVANTQNGLIIDLTAGTIVVGANSEVAINFENVNGSNQDDSIRGTSGANTLNGNDGNDVLDGGLDADVLSGGLGLDRATYANSAAGLTVNLSDATQNTGEAAGDTYNSIENLTGSAFKDNLTGNNGINSIIAGAGDDTVSGLNGDDNLFGQDGNDILEGGVGADDLSGGAGSDRATYANAAAGIVAALLSAAQNTGEALGDTFTSIENLTGSAFADTLKGTNNINSLIGGNGDDNLIGFGGDDNLFGQDGNDVLNGGTGADALSGGLGSDRATYEDATAGVTAALLSPATNTGDAAGDTFTSIENLTGSAFDDKLTGTSGINSLIGGNGKDTLIGLGGDDNLFGQDGNDTFDGGAGADDFSGGNGTDTVTYNSAAVGVVASLAAPATNTNDAAGDTYSSIENLTGSGFGDTLTGNNVINVIVGGAGSDLLFGRLGNDTLTGNTGKDQFVFDTALGATNVDTITDFVFTDDTIRLDDAIFNAIVGGPGTLSAAQFTANAAGVAGDADDRIIYETDTGNIFYDTNGSAAGGSTLFAIVGAGLGITNADFLII
ncbi:beta strand repeat-containing protein [Mesorhizobium sp. ASY16-5R]|uniref:beta strand repeat-containing protein n=1 Tax=Mesorhizobium sp. ASY16-5R TaxID=3445772 RepID=UPI003F9F152E